MKKLISASAALLAALCLSSCLRDATPTVQSTKATEEPMTHMTETVPTDTLPEMTEPHTEEPPAQPNEQVAKWTSLHPSPGAVIMTAADIEAENKRMMEESDALVDIISYADTVSAEELRRLIDRNGVPSETRYDSDGTPITPEHTENVKALMCIEDSADFDVKLGIMTSRGNLRAIPDKKPYRKAPDNPYDSIQHTELSASTPVLVLYTTANGEYHFIVSYSYSGWMSTSDVALTDSRELWMSFASPESFVCVTDAFCRVGDVTLDMGCVLPMVSDEGESFTVLLPVRQADGTLGKDEISLSKASASEGYLDYTYENYLTQAFKYEGTDYGWGGLDGGIDCSGFVHNVFRCFGFRLPRDTKDQDDVVGSAISVAGKDHAYIADKLDGAVPTAVYYPGHTLLYIGHDAADGKYYFIHAPQIGEKVSVTSKTDLKGMTYIGVVGGHSS